MSSSSSSSTTYPPSLPPTHRALVLTSLNEPLTLQTLPTPQPTPGSAILRILSAGIISYNREIYTPAASRPYPFPTPLTTGTSAIARVLATGPDATALPVGKLVFVDCFIHARDDPGTYFLTAIHEGGSEASRRLMREVWRDGTWAEVARAPVENCIPLDEGRLCGELGYGVHELMSLMHLLVAYGGLRDVGVQAGDRVAVVPATGNFGGAGVQVAVSMGASVVAMGRNGGELERVQEYMKEGNGGAAVETVRLTGDEKVDGEAIAKKGPFDAVLDFTPPAAAGSAHMKHLVQALRWEGKVSLMGSISLDKVSMWEVLSKGVMFKGKLMYDREDEVQFVKMLEQGRLPKGNKLADVKVFKLEQWKEAMDVAAEFTGLGRIVTFAP